MRKARLIHKPEHKYPNISNGEIFLIGPTPRNKGTHFYFYKLDGSFLGCFPSKWFLALDSSSDIEKNGHSKKEEMDGEQFEQLTLF